MAISRPPSVQDEIAGLFVEQLAEQMKDHERSDWEIIKTVEYIQKAVDELRRNRVPDA